MKATEVMKLMEMMKTFPKEDKMPRRRGPPKHFDKMRDADVIALLHRRLEEADTLKKLLDDREKANKKEDKKKDGPNIHEIAIFLMLTYPIIGVLLFLFTRR